MCCTLGFLPIYMIVFMKYYCVLPHELLITVLSVVITINDTCNYWTNCDS